MKTFKRILRVFLVIFCIVFVNGCYYVFHGQFKSVEKLNQGKELNLYECCSIYTMHMGVWMFGWWYAPEAAKECFLLHFPAPKSTGGMRFSATSTAFDNSKVLNNAVARISKKEGSSIPLVWGEKDYALSSPEHRIAVAINPAKLVFFGGFLNPDPTEWYELHSEMVYPLFSETHFRLSNSLTVILHEGLFRYLQDKGWLSKYTMCYTFSVPAKV